MRRLILLLTFAAALVTAPIGRASPLTDFVARPDTSYAVGKSRLWTSDGISFLEAPFTSQTFQGERWRHLVVLAKPKTLAVTVQALLLIGGGHNDRTVTPPEDLARIAALATKSGMIAAMVEDVPFQPTLGGKLEDEAIAFTLTQFFKTGDPSWPLLQPMVKSVVRGMDAVQALAAEAWGVKLAGFTVAGVSKRGWTTWLVAAADARVKALAPQVFDILNIRPQLRHQLASWGEYSEQIGDYSRQGLPAMLETPRGGDLLGIIDPFSFRAELTQPKLVVLATNDRYWPVDSANLYFDELPGAKYLLYVAGEGHDVSDRGVIEDDRVALALAAAGKLTLPQIRGQAEKGALTLTTDVLPKRVRFWRASAPSHDFRASKWEIAAEPAPALANRFLLPVPAQGFNAGFIEATFDLAGRPFTATGPVTISGNAPHGSETKK